METFECLQLQKTQRLQIVTTVVTTTKFPRVFQAIALVACPLTVVNCYNAMCRFHGGCALLRSRLQKHPF